MSFMHDAVLINTAHQIELISPASPHSYFCKGVTFMVSDKGVKPLSDTNTCQGD